MIAILGYLLKVNIVMKWRCLEEGVVPSIQKLATTDGLQPPP
jgi:hypothetical protein